MFLYSLTLQRSTSINASVYGNFSAPRSHEIAVARGNVLELLSPDDSGKLAVVSATNVFGHIRSLAVFRLTGTKTDYLVVGSDSGRITILQFNADKQSFERVHMETYGKTGCRRIVPGEYVAADPRGRAVLVGAIEKQKFVYVMNRDSGARLTISSPLEAHKAYTICSDVVGVDVGFDNPIFAALEVSYEDADSDASGESARNAQREVVLYQLDLGLNHVVRKWSTPVPRSAHRMIALPGGADGPSGVLVCCDDALLFVREEHPVVAVEVPRREGPLSDPERGVMITASALVKQKGMFFVLVQNELGDLFKVTVATDENKNVRGIRCQYFDTITPARSLCILRSGFLFCAAEAGDHGLYQFQGIGDDSDPTGAAVSTEDLDATLTLTPEDRTYYAPRDLQNLVKTDSLPSMSPVLDANVGDYAREGAPQLWACSGRGGCGGSAAVRVLRHGLPVAELAASELPGTPSAVWAVKGDINDEASKYIVVSFANATIVLAVGETVEEVEDSGLLRSTNTLSVSLIGENSLVQVFPGGLRHVRSDGRVNEWKAPGKRQVTHASSNERQVVIALDAREIITFELDDSGMLLEGERREMDADVTAVAVPAVPEGRRRASFLAVSTSDNSVQVLGTEPGEGLAGAALQAVPAAVTALCFAGSTLHIGLDNGVLTRAAMDSSSGQLSDARARFLGTRPVRLVGTQAAGSPAVLALSSRAWLCYDQQGRYTTVPLSYAALEHASPFATPAAPDAIVGVAANTLRIIAVERLGEAFHQQSVACQYTPRRLVQHPQSRHIVTIEADHHTLTEGELKSALDEFAQVKKEQGKDGDAMDTEDGEAGADQEQDVAAVIADDPLKRSHRAEDGKWASAVSLIDPASVEIVSRVELDANECAVSLCSCSFRSRESDVYIVVGTARDLKISPRSHAGGELRVYSLGDDGRSLSLVHCTHVEEPPYALASFCGQLAVGLGRTLRLYDMGKKKMLRKCEKRPFPSMIVSIKAQGRRLYVSDASESVTFVTYNKEQNQLYPFADDTVPRHMMAVETLDYNTVVGSDKFGNIFVNRLREGTLEDPSTDPASTKVSWERGLLNGAPQKVENIVNFHVGEVVTSINRSSLQPNGAESIIFTTIRGGIGAFMPFASRADVDFFSHLELSMRQEAPPLCGRDHLMYRSYFFPVKNVIDGDLCEQFAELDSSKQRAIAEELDRTPDEIIKKLEDVRARVL